MDRTPDHYRLQERATYSVQNKVHCFTRIIDRGAGVVPESFFCIEGNVASAPEVGGETHVVLLGRCPQRLVLTTATTTSLISYSM